MPVGQIQITDGSMPDAQRGGAVYGFGVMPIDAAGHAARALGVARSTP